MRRKADSNTDEDHEDHENGAANVQEVEVRLGTEASSGAEAEAGAEDVGREAEAVEAVEAEELRGLDADRGAAEAALRTSFAARRRSLEREAKLAGADEGAAAGERALSYSPAGPEAPTRIMCPSSTPHHMIAVSQAQTQRVRSQATRERQRRATFARRASLRWRS